MAAEVNRGGVAVTRVNRLIERPRVFDRLGRDWPAPLLVVTAPAGLGKTTTITLACDLPDIEETWTLMLRHGTLSHRAGADDGDAGALHDLLGLLDDFDFWFNIVTP